MMISINIRGKYVDTDMDINVNFHIHGKLLLLNCGRLRRRVGYAGNF